MLIEMQWILVSFSINVSCMWLSGSLAALIVCSCGCPLITIMLSRFNYISLVNQEMAIITWIILELEFIGKDPDAGKDWGQEEKWTTEDEMVGWHHRLDGHGFGWTLGIDDGQGGLVCCGSWGCKELDTTEWLNRTEQISAPIRLWTIVYTIYCNWTSNYV